MLTAALTLGGQMLISVPKPYNLRMFLLYEQSFLEILRNIPAETRNPIKPQPYNEPYSAPSAETSLAQVVGNPKP